MSSEYSLAGRHFAALVTEARVSEASLEILGRALIDEVVRVWSETRSPEDIASELRFIADNVGETDFEFMRP